MDGEPKLLEASLAGDRQAFGKIVEQYQSLICAVTFSGTGDLALSEDLAQETFVTAWTSLRELRDRTNLRGWLCGIARNLSKDSVRKRSRDITTQAKPLAQAGAAESRAPTPLEHAISKEEAALLWRALKEIPQTYREPLVLYYREQKSVRKVAEELGLSEDAVKQRLVRGRRALKGQVAAFVEGTLARTRPSEIFTIAVVAALPAIAPQAAAAVTATAIRGSAAAKSLFATGLSGAVWGPLLGILGGVVGAWASIINTRSPRERKFVVKATWLVTAYVLGFLGILFLAWVSLSSSPSLPWVMIGVWGLYVVGLFALIAWGNGRQRQIRIEDGTYVDPRQARDASAGRPLSKGAIYGSFAGAIFGAVCWVFVISYVARDWITPFVVLAVASALFAVSTRVCLGAPRAYHRIAMGTGAGLAALNLAVINVRWEGWMVAYRQSSFYQPANDLPLWLMNLIILGLFGFLCLLFFVLHRSQRAARQAGNSHGTEGQTGATPQASPGSGP